MDYQMFSTAQEAFLRKIAPRLNIPRYGITCPRESKIVAGRIRNISPLTEQEIEKGDRLVANWQEKYKNYIKDDNGYPLYSKEKDLEYQRIEKSMKGMEEKIEELKNQAISLVMTDPYFIPALRNKYFGPQWNNDDTNFNARVFNCWVAMSVYYYTTPITEIPNYKESCSIASKAKYLFDDFNRYKTKGIRRTTVFSYIPVDDWEEVKSKYQEYVEECKDIYVKGRREYYINTKYPRKSRKEWYSLFYHYCRAGCFPSIEDWMNRKERAILLYSIEGNMKHLTSLNETKYTKVLESVKL